MSRVTIEGIINTAIISAFTIATALIWKDVIVEVIELLFPTEILLLKFIAAVFSTIIIVVMIYIILRAETETGFVLRRMKNGKKNKKA